MSVFRIPKNTLKENFPNFIDFDDINRFVVLKKNNSIKIFKNLCPHMGAAFEKKSYCHKTRHLNCPWHGYKFSVDSLELTENPNIEHWAKPLVDSDSHFLKLRKYKLIEVTFTEENAEILITPKS